MNEDFATFELAKKLKEKGFNKECFAHYDDLGNLLLDKDYWKLDSHILTPTISQVLKWLREEKNIHITIDVDINDNFNFYFTILKKGRESWEVLQYGESCKTYEQSAIAGITWALDNLI